MNRNSYVKLYLERSGLNARKLSKKLGYSKNMVSDWISGYRKVKDFSMNHLILFRKFGSGFNISGSAHIKNSIIISEILYKTDSDSRGDLLFLVSEELKKTNTNYTASLIKRAAAEYGYNE